MPEPTQSDDTAEILRQIQDVGKDDVAGALMEIYEATERVYRATVAGSATVGAAVSTNGPVDVPQTPVDA
jgi:hypothetical protein